MGVAAFLPLALFTGLGGLIAYLAGAVGLAEIRRLGRVGVPVEALVKRRPADEGDTAGASRPLLQFLTEEGRVMEVFSPVPPARLEPLADGSRVWVTYDPADPRRLMVRGRERRWLEYAFLGLGAVVVLGAFVLFALAG